MARTRFSETKKQTRLAFSPLPSSSPQRPYANVRVDESSSPAKKRRTNAGSPVIKVEVPAVRPTQLPTPAPSSQALHADADRHAIPSDEEEDEDDLVLPSSRPRRLVAKIPDGDLESFSDYPVNPRTPSKNASQSQSARTFQLGGSSAGRKSSIRSKIRGRRPISLDSESSDSESNFVTSSRSLNEGRDSRRDEQATLQTSIASGPESAASDSEDIVVVSPRRRRRRIANRKISTSDGGAGNVDAEADQLRDEAEDLSDLNEDVADLQDTELKNSRTRGRPQATERDKRKHKLEELKKLRASRAETGGIDSEDDKSDLEVEDGKADGFEALAYDDGGDLDEYEEDFVDDEQQDHLGVDLMKSGVPLHLTSQANLKPFDYFRYEVEWMIHNKLDPAFERRDEIYLMAHQKLDDEVKGHAGSTYKSSAWTAKFSAALISRPDIYQISIPAMLEDKCDACNRSRHPPKYRITLAGKKYDRDTLEPLSIKNESEDGSDSDVEDNENDDDNNNKNADDFNLGRFCAANAEIAHALYHWRYQLNQTILEWLSCEGHTSPDKIIKRENWSRKKRERLANKIVDGMIDGGEMKELYKQFKQNLAAARSAKPERFADEL